LAAATIVIQEIIYQQKCKWVAKVAEKVHVIHIQITRGSGSVSVSNMLICDESKKGPPGKILLPSNIFKHLLFTLHCG
jgi:hypothetical protein